MIDEWREYARAWRFIATTLLIVGVAVAVVYAFGGLASDQQRRIPRVLPGQRVVCNDWFLRPERASIVTTSPAGVAAEPGGAFLVLEAAVENRTRTTRVDIDQAFRWQNGTRTAFAAGVAADQVVLLRDRVNESSLQPGLEDRVALVWKLPPNRVFGGVQVWQLIGREWIAKDKLNGGGGWLKSHAVADIAFTLDDPRDAVAPRR